MIAGIIKYYRNFIFHSRAQKNGKIEAFHILVIFRSVSRHLRCDNRHGFAIVGFLLGRLFHLFERQRVDENPRDKQP